LEVTGSGTETPEGITADKLYTPTDPGIKVNVYGDNSNYEMPGPALFSGASSGSGSSSSGNSTAPAPASSAPAATSAAPAAAQVAAASSSPVASSAAPAATGSAGALPETFTLETFISWLEKSAGSSSTKSRRSRVFRA
jgi:cellulase